jgi:predicted ATPase
MITRIEIDGFKTFSDFKLTLGSLQVIVGSNGAGKSNLFDALLLLSQLADTDLRTAFQNLRGEAGELFTIRADGKRTERIRLAVELLVEPTIADSWGAEANLKYTRLRYELAIVRQTDDRGLERLYVDHESLTLIPRGKDEWIRRYNLTGKHYWLPPLTGGRAPFISTEKKENVATIYLHQDGRSGRKGSVAARMERTVLSGVANTEFPHAFAVREEMRSWRFLQLNPETLRQPSSMVGPQVMTSEGRYLPGMLARLKAEDPMLLADISRDLANLVPGIIKVEVEPDRTRDEYVIWAQTQDVRRFSSRVLSDGTLRMLALVALKNDPQHRGVVLFEEPENGVHPFRLKNIAGILSQLATDFDDPDQEGAPLRQFLCNTHSPVFISQTPIMPHLLFAYTVTRSDPRHPQALERITRMTPVISSPTQPSLGMEITSEERIYTLEEVKAYLNSADLGEAHSLLGRNGNTAASEKDVQQR